MDRSQAKQRGISTRRRIFQERGMVLTRERIEEFLAHQQGKGTVEATIKRYRHDLKLLYADLPEEKEIRRETLRRWRESLLERGYAARTVNVCISAANSLLAYFGRRELQLTRRLEPEAGIQPELTRTEYLRLLGTARALEKRQLYLLIKLFAGTGLPVQALPKVTVEAVDAGSIAIVQGGEQQVVHIPDCLRQELLDFAADTGRSSGPIFVTGGGTPLGRTNVSSGIRKLCAQAQVPEEKGNPRCLRRLYQSTRAGIEANVSLLVEQAHERLLDAEQRSIGWRLDD